MTHVSGKRYTEAGESDRKHEARKPVLSSGKPAGPSVAKTPHGRFPTRVASATFVSVLVIALCVKKYLRDLTEIFRFVG